MRAGAVACVLALCVQPWSALGMEVDLFAHKDKFGQSLNMDISERECTNVARPWVNVTMSVDTHGSCMQFYDGKSCTGRIAVIQPFHTVHQMDLSLINFHNVIQSISPCGAKVPTGRYVIQSAVDASILTVSKYENQFAFVHTLPPRAFIPKAQQWEIHEKAATEYDVMPRIHETNTPVTYDAEAMKRGSFIRKVWKIESVGRGRYVFKNEWSGKCLYKTRFRTIEEHDCRAWSPNQEWVLRPLLTLPKPTAPAPAQVSDEVKYQVPSRIVDQYLEQQKFLREQEELGNGKISGYKIKRKNKKPKQTDSEEGEDEESRESAEDSSFRARKQQTEPPKPEVFYSRSQPSFLRRQFSRYSQPQPEMMYMEGTYPIFNNDVKVEDPAFPDFLLHAASQDDESDSDKKADKYKPARYTVTRRPLTIPLPTGHPSFNPGKPKYDGRLKDPDYRKKLEEEAEEEESEEEEEEEDEVEAEEPEPTSEDQVHEALLRDKEERQKRKKKQESEESEEEQDDDDGGEEEDDEEKTEAQKIRDRDAAKESEEDPAVTAAGFLKLLFKGISNKMQHDEKEKAEMIHSFE